MRQIRLPKILIIFIFGITYFILSPLINIKANAANYYVSTSGNDANTGTQTNPWRTIQKAVNTVSNGSTVYISGGTYNEAVSITRNASSAAPIKIFNFDTNVVKVNGGSSPAIHVTGTGSKYWDIEGLTLVSSADYTVYLDSWGCNGACSGIDYMTFRNNKISGMIFVYGAYNLFENNDVDGTTNNGSGDGIWESYETSHHNTYRGNTIHNFTRRAIWSMHRTHDSLFENNIIHDIPQTEAMCLDLDGYGTAVWRQTVRGNVITNCGTYGIQLENTYDSTLENNQITNAKGAGISILNYGPDIPAPGPTACTLGGENNQYGSDNNNCEGLDDNVRITNNTIKQSGNQGAIAIWYAGGLSITGDTFADNIGNGINIFNSIANLSPQITLQNNYFSQNIGPDVSIYGISSLNSDSNNTFIKTDSTSIYEDRNGWKTYSLASYKTATGKGQGSLWCSTIPPLSPTIIPTSTPPPKLGDANGDSKVNGLDYVIWLNHFGQSASGVSSGDFNTDGKVNGLDYVVWLNNFGK
jgi:parallel beta-helix repeat protein